MGAFVKIRSGQYKGCKGRVKDVKGDTVRIELESQMKTVAGKSLFWQNGFLSQFFYILFDGDLAFLQLSVNLFQIIPMLHH